MSHKKKPLAERIDTPAFRSRQARVNSLLSPWRKPNKHGSARQRRVAAYFEELERRGDTRRVPRPELDK